MDALQNPPLAPFNLNVRHRLLSRLAHKYAPQDGSSRFQVDHPLQNLARIEPQSLRDAGGGDWPE